MFGCSLLTFFFLFLHFSSLFLYFLFCVCFMLAILDKAYTALQLFHTQKLKISHLTNWANTTHFSIFPRSQKNSVFRQTLVLLLNSACSIGLLHQNLRAVSEFGCGVRKSFTLFYISVSSSSRFSVIKQNFIFLKRYCVRAYIYALQFLIHRFMLKAE